MVAERPLGAPNFMQENTFLPQKIIPSWGTVLLSYQFGST